MFLERINDSKLKYFIKEINVIEYLIKKYPHSSTINLVYYSKFLIIVSIFHHCYSVLMTLFIMKKVNVKY